MTAPRQQEPSRPCSANTGTSTTCPGPVKLPPLQPGTTTTPGTGTVQGKIDTTGRPAQREALSTLHRIDTPTLSQHPGGVLRPILVR